jgi:hypothetical protein
VTRRPDITPYLPIVKGKAREVARHYPGLLEAQDLEQEIALWWYSAPVDALTSYLQDDGLSRLRRAFWRHARDYAEKQRRAQGGPEVFVQSRYAAAEVAAMLPVALDPDGIPEHRAVDETGRQSKGNVAWGGNLLASLVDVRRALKAALTEDDRQFLLWVDAARNDWDKVGRLVGIEPDSARRRHARIAGRMAAWLNNDENEEEAA